MDGDHPWWGWHIYDFRFGCRLRFRLRHGFWCEHTLWSRGTLIQEGRRKMYLCLGCGHARIP